MTSTNKSCPVDLRDWSQAIDNLREDVKALRFTKAEKESIDLRFEGAKQMQEQVVQRITEDIADIKSDVSQLSDKISKRSTIQLGSIVALIIAIAGGISFIIKMDSRVETNIHKVEANTKSVKFLTDTVEQTGQDVKSIKESVENNTEERRLRDMRTALRTVLNEDGVGLRQKDKRLR